MDLVVSIDICTETQSASAYQTGVLGRLTLVLSNCEIIIIIIIIIIIA